MLKLYFIIMSVSSLSLMFTMNAWWYITITFILLVPLSIMWVLPNSMYLYSKMSCLDLMSGTLAILSILIVALMLMASTKIYPMYNAEVFLAVNTGLLWVLLKCFTSASLVNFYIWFEASLIPTLMIIVVWGYQPERIQASMYLMLYTITASLPMFMIFCSIMLYSHTGKMALPLELYFPPYLSSFPLFWTLTLAGFLVKLPMFSVHLWLPKAHVEAPIAGSMILAAILLKLGGYGLARMLQLFPKMYMSNSSMLMSLSLCGAVATSFICMRQPDIKSLIAYSSVGHMGLMLAGLLSNSVWGMSGSLMMMIAHGLSSSALFILANMSYEITHTRSMFLSKGLMCINPTMSMWWFLFTAANMAAPPSINLLSEIMLITAIMSTSVTSLLLISFISFFTAAYSLHMFSSTQHGQISSFSNPLQVMKSKDMLLLLIHIIPIVMLIFKPELIGNWL